MGGAFALPAFSDTKDGKPPFAAHVSDVSVADEDETALAALALVVDDVR